jgi:hypothetical protein
VITLEIIILSREENWFFFFFADDLPGYTAARGECTSQAHDAIYIYKFSIDHLDPNPLSVSFTDTAHYTHTHYQSIHIAHIRV